MFQAELLLFVSYICHLTQHEKQSELQDALPSVQRLCDTYEATPDDEFVVSMLLKILQCTSFPKEREQTTNLLLTFLFSPKW
jgi:hypothetical protein